MTTFVHDNGLLMVDSRCTSSGGSVEWYYPTVKMRASALFVAVCAGCMLPCVFLRRLPFLLMLRFLGWAVFPALAHGAHRFESAQVYVVWRNGARWVLNTTCKRFGPFGVARVHSRQLHPAGTTMLAMAMGGSGSAHFTLDDLEAHGAAAMMARAAEEDPATDDQLAVFDTESWRLVQDHPFLPKGRVARAFAAFRSEWDAARAHRPAHAQPLHRGSSHTPTPAWRRVGPAYR